MTAYYNEIDPFAVGWLRELIREGIIADGIVDDRSIEIVEPRDLDGFTQCHFFAGIGVWSYALRLAGWPDDRPVWTGSCPCQPFSAAGKEEGFADPRHLWPSWFRLARVYRPVTIFGEQVDRAIRSRWLDLVSTDLEAEGYAVGSVVYGSHSVGAPHRRQRLYFVADRDSTNGPQSGGLSDPDGSEQRQREFGFHAQGRSDHGSSPVRERTAGLVADTSSARRRGNGAERSIGQEERLALPSERSGFGDAVGARLERHDGYVDDWNEPRRLRAFSDGSTTPTGILSGFWDRAEWIECTDGKARPVEPGSFPLAYGSPARVGRLRGYGNAINAEAAASFVVAFREVKGEL